MPSPEDSRAPGSQPRHREPLNPGTLEPLNGSTPITRRSFVARLVQVGVASAAATRVADSVYARPMAGNDVRGGRVLEGLTGGELMAEFLREWHVPYVFGLGGSEEVGFLDALVDRLDLQYVQALHEGSVMSMADGYARASGQTAFVNLHSVAGTAYALSPLVDAYKDRIPIVLTAGRQGTTVRGSNAFLEAVNLNELPRQYTRWNWDVLSAETIPEVLRRAFLLARVPPGGPTFVTVSKDLWEAPVDRAEILPPERSELRIDVQPDPDLVKRTVDMLLAAQLPVITAGRELDRYGGVDELQEIAELLGAPVFMDVSAAHCPLVFPTSHPLYGGMYLEDPAFTQNLDVYWSVGASMFTVSAPPPAPLVPRTAQAIHTGLDASEIGRNYPVDVAMLANVKSAATAVLDELRTRSLPRSVIDARRRVVEQHGRERRARLQAEADRLWDDGPIASQRLSVELDRRLDKDALLVTELVTSEQLFQMYVDTARDGGRRRHLTSSGGCLGWGVAAAVGAKIAQPDRQVVSLVGDGSFQFGVQALWSAVRYEVPIPIVVWNNGGYQANRRFLHAYGRRAAATGKYVGASLGAPEIDNVKIAAGYGVEAERVDDPAELGAALDRCLAASAAGRPYLLDVQIARRYGGAESTWHDFFSVARQEPRAT